MRKLFLVTLAASFLVAAAVPAIAVEPKFSGNYRIRGEVFDESTAVDSDNTASYWDTRLRMKMDLAVSENLKAVYQLEIGDISLGGAGMQNGYTSTGASLLADGQGRFTSANGGAGTDVADVETKHLYLDVTLPNTSLNLKAGLMPLKLGHGIILDNDFSAVLLTANLEPVQIGLFTFKTAENNVESADDIDFYGLSATAEMCGATIGLYGVHGVAEGDAQAAAAVARNGGLAAGTYEKAELYWGGITADVNLDAVSIALEADYFGANYTGKGGTADAGACGFLGYADIGLKLEKSKVGIAGFYASGNENDDMGGNNDTERFMPILPANREDYAVLNWDNMFLLDGIGQYGANVLSNLYSVKVYANCGAMNDLDLGLSAQGYWKAEDVNAHGKGLDDFYGYEFDLDLAYRIYQQLTYNINAAYMVCNQEALGGRNATSALGTPVSAPNPDPDHVSVQDIWFVGHSLVYNF